MKKASPQPTRRHVPAAPEPRAKAPDVDQPRQPAREAEPTPQIASAQPKEVETHRWWDRFLPGDR